MSNITPNYREEITEKIIKALKEGTAPWQKEWSQDCVPVNAVTGKTYNCVNLIILSIAGNEMSSDGDMRWATRNQAASRGWVIKLGEKATRIDIYPMIDKKDKFGHLVKMSSGETAQTRIKKTIELYHASQMIGIPRSKGFKRKTIINNEVIERIIYNSSARIFERGKEAYYSPRDDLIIMPPKTAFTDTESYYSTLLHELSHWTGHEKRLKRFYSWSKDTKDDYAREELVAEIASMYLSSETGLPQTEKHFANHASYVATWIKLLENDPNEIFTASTEAKKAVDFILSFKDEVKEEIAV